MFRPEEMAVASLPHGARSGRTEKDQTTVSGNRSLGETLGTTHGSQTAARTCDPPRNVRSPQPDSRKQILQRIREEWKRRLGNRLAPIPHEP